MPPSHDFANHLATPEICCIHILNIYSTSNLLCVHVLRINSRKSLIEQKVQPGEPGDPYVSPFYSRCFEDTEFKMQKPYLEE